MVVHKQLTQTCDPGHFATGVDEDGTLHCMPDNDRHSCLHRVVLNTLDYGVPGEVVVQCPAFHRVLAASATCVGNHSVVGTALDGSGAVRA